MNDESVELQWIEIEEREESESGKEKAIRESKGLACGSEKVSE